MTQPELPPSNGPAPVANDRASVANDRASVASSVATYERLPLLGALLKFNVKLIANGLLDLVLVPASFLAVVLGMAMGGHEPGRYFRELMLFGRRTERWISLFGGHGEAGRRNSIDALLGTYEKEVAAIFERRGWSAPTEAALRNADLGGRRPGAGVQASASEEPTGGADPAAARPPTTPAGQ